MKGVLKDEIDAREIGGPGFVQENIIFPRIDEIIPHNMITTNQSTGEREEQVLNLFEDGFSSEDDILIILEEERDNDYCSKIG